jgi:hypothetical protein
MSEPEAEQRQNQSQANATSVPHPASAASSRNAVPAGTDHADDAPGPPVAGGPVHLAPGAAIQVVQPSTYLRRPRGHSRPMTPSKPLSSVDREQIEGLVS